METRGCVPLKAEDGISLGELVNYGVAEGSLRSVTPGGKSYITLNEIQLN